MRWRSPAQKYAVFNDGVLDPERHDRSGFACGVPELDEYLQRLAHQHWRKGISTTYVLTDPAQPQRILGYYTLSAAQIDFTQLAESDRRKLPRYPVPCFRMGRLASCADQRGQGLGTLLIGRAVDRCLDARRQVAAFALTVDAKDALAKGFYVRHGFIPFSMAPLSLYLPLSA